MAKDIPACELCAERNGRGFETPITMAFQPIVNLTDRSIWAYEALVRGQDGAPAGDVLSKVNEQTLYAFDQKCRRTAIELASRLGIDKPISINFMPNAVYEPANCIRATLAAADKHSFPIENIIFEITEQEAIREPDHLKGIFEEYRRRGFRTAIDDFGAGFAGLGLLAEMQPNIIKIDRSLVSHIDTSRSRQAILEGLLTLARRLDITVLAEGVECPEEADLMRTAGIELFQGYLFSPPAFEAAVGVDDIAWP